jgi:hypothetical protein
MRGVLFACAVACLLVSSPRLHASVSAASAPTISAASTTFALQVPDKKIEVTVGERGSGAWYRSPVWIAIGVLAFIVLVLLIVLLSRSGGGGTTIIRE